MAPTKSPAFRLYASDFLTGTATMSLQEVGAYIRLLCFQWDAGGVPEDASERARIMGCSKAQERELWKRVARKFAHIDGVYVNERMEVERKKQAERREQLSENGKQGGRPSKANGKLEESNSFSETKANEKPKQSLPFSFSSSVSDPKSEAVPPTTKHRGVGLVVGGAHYARLLETHAFVGSVLRVPKVLHAELLGKSGGAHREPELESWYLALNDELETKGEGTGDVFAWLRPRHQAFAVSKGWIAAAPRPAAPQAAYRGIAAIMADAEAKKAGAK